MALGHPLAREDGRLAGGLRAERPEARPGERAEDGGAGFAGERGLDLELASARGVELGNGMRLGREAAGRTRERLAKERVVGARVRPARVDRAARLRAPTMMRARSCGALRGTTEPSRRTERTASMRSRSARTSQGGRSDRPALAYGWPLIHARNRPGIHCPRIRRGRAAMPRFPCKSGVRKATSGPGQVG